MNSQQQTYRWCEEYKHGVQGTPAPPWWDVHASQGRASHGAAQEKDSSEEPQVPEKCQSLTELQCRKRERVSTSSRREHANQTEDMVVSPDGTVLSSVQYLWQVWAGVTQTTVFSCQLKIYTGPHHSACPLPTGQYKNLQQCNNQYTPINNRDLRVSCTLLNRDSANVKKRLKISINTKWSFLPNTRFGSCFVLYF